MKTIFKSDRSSTTTITNTPRIEFEVGRKFKDHTIVYKIVNGQRIRLKCIRNTNPLKAQKASTRPATPKVISIATIPDQQPAA